ncbi:cilia- and flagella-associated protein 161 [Nematolebias whitei]|uniref:cilia- and flagella-associated protein 161 n=1 Tax=Nematolebias whitei TaxID=451745 RepID=UPI00189C4BFB|nr:cilia- and flagella-associated protein 161 [Nematolebias whitei]
MLEMAQFRCYQSKAKAGNWREDQVLEETKMKEYLEKKEKGELVAQKVDLLKQNILQPVNLSVTNDGNLHFGDVVMLVNMGGEHGECSVVSINCDIHSLTNVPSLGIQAPCQVSAGSSIQPCTRTAFIITSVDSSPEGATLHFEQNFALKTTSGFARGLYLTSDLKSFQKCAKMSRLQEVYLDKSDCFLSWWKMVHFDPQERLEYEGLPVPANVKVLIKHCKTNQALAVLENQVFWNTYGKEYEVTAQTFLDSHKAEQDNNHWILCTSDPAGDGLALLKLPQSAAKNQFTDTHLQNDSIQA